MIRRLHLIVEGVDIWFQHGKPILGYSTPASSSHYFRTINKARRMAKGIIDKYSGAVVVIGRWHDSKEEIWRKNGNL